MSSGVFHSLPCTAAFVLNTEHNQMGSVNHFSVSSLMGIFEMTDSGSFADFNFIIILPERIFIISELCCGIGQHQNMGAVVASIISLAPPNNRGNKLVKFTVPSG